MSLERILSIVYCISIDILWLLSLSSDLLMLITRVVLSNSRRFGWASPGSNAPMASHLFQVVVGSSLWNVQDFARVVAWILCGFVKVWVCSFMCEWVSMSVFMCVYVQMFMRMFVCAYVNARVNVCVLYVCVYFVYIILCLCMVRLSVYICVCVGGWVYECLCVFLNVCNFFFFLKLPIIVYKEEFYPCG